MICLLKYERRGDHVHVAVHMGEDRERGLALCGTLVMYVGEWQLFGAALGLGTRQMIGHLTVVSEGSLK